MVKLLDDDPPSLPDRLSRAGRELGELEAEKGKVEKYVNKEDREIEKLKYEIHRLDFLEESLPVPSSG